MNNSFLSDNILLGWIRESKLKEGDKLPSERKLSASLDLSRGELRKALMFLEMGGIIERFIGKGTFLSLNSTDLRKNEFSINKLVEITSPHDAMIARLSLEPELASNAAFYGLPKQFKEIRKLSEDIKKSKSWAEYEKIDTHFHLLIAEATQNPLLIETFKIINAVRTSVIWPKLVLPKNGPPINYHSFTEHDEIISALEHRDREGAYSAMKKHLKSTRGTFLKDE